MKGLTDQERYGVLVYRRSQDVGVARDVTHVREGNAALSLTGEWVTIRRPREHYPQVLCKVEDVVSFVARTSSTRSEWVDHVAAAAVIALGDEWSIVRLFDEVRGIVSEPYEVEGDMVQMFLEPSSYRGSALGWSVKIIHAETDETLDHVVSGVAIWKAMERARDIVRYWRTDEAKSTR